LPDSSTQRLLALQTAVEDDLQSGVDACLKHARLLARCHAMAGGMSLRQSAKESAKSASIVFISQTPVQEDIASPKVVEEWRGLRVVSPRRATNLAKEGPASTCLIKFWPVPRMIRTPVTVSVRPNPRRRDLRRGDVCAHLSVNRSGWVASALYLNCLRHGVERARYDPE
jgi:hypothetical protein